MSQNFELLSQIEAGYAVPRAASNESTARRQTRNSDFSQELMSLVQGVFLSQSAEVPHQVVFCGVDSDNGSSRVCLEVGQILAAYGGHPVCVVDADVRSLRLSGLLSGNRRAEVSTLVHDGCIEVAPNLWLTAIEPSNPIHSGVLAPACQLKQRLAELSRAFEFVLIDAPDANIRGDAAVLGQVADAAILVIEANSTRKAAAMNAKKSLQAMNVRLLGTVLNNRTFPIPEQLYRKL